MALLVTDKNGTRELILAAALRCLCAKGTAGTTLAEIRRLSGATVGSIYHFFDGKDDIVGTLYVEAIEGHQQALLAQLERSASAEQTVRTLVRGYLAWVSENPELARFVLRTKGEELPERFRRTLSSRNRAFFAAVRAQIEHHTALGELRVLPPEAFSAVIIGPSHHAARTWLDGDGKRAPKELAAYLADAAWLAVRAPPRASKITEPTRRRR
jgi:AcrR family transcriptional regulator